jgi:hypothetical protein
VRQSLLGQVPRSENTATAACSRTLSEFTRLYTTTWPRSSIRQITSANNLPAAEPMGTARRKAKPRRKRRASWEASEFQSAALRALRRRRRRVSKSEAAARIEVVVPAVENVTHRARFAGGRSSSNDCQMLRPDPKSHPQLSMPKPRQKAGFTT